MPIDLFGEAVKLKEKNLHEWKVKEIAAYLNRIDEFKKEIEELGKEITRVEELKIKPRREGDRY